MFWFARAKVIWFVRRESKFVELELTGDGTLKSRVFPGLWLDPAALLAGDMRRVQAVLNQGLASAEHARFLIGLATPSR